MAAKKKSSKFVGDAGDFKRITPEEFEKRRQQRAEEDRLEAERRKALRQSSQDA